MPADAGYAYDPLFFDYIEQGAIRSARAIAPLVLGALGAQSVLDVGCGAGAWLSVYRECGVTDVRGVDGTYVRRDQLLIPPDEFRAVNVSERFSLGRTFDLVQSLEVAEHLPRDASRTFVANLVAHGPCVLFSAAVPGQGGEHHTNERPLEYWRALFAEHHYVPYDIVRPRIPGDAAVEAWYAYNTLLYVDETHASLPPDVLQMRIADGAPIPNVASLAYRIRYAILRSLPVALVTRLAILKHSMVVARRRPGI